MKIKASRPIHHGMKISFLLLSHLPDHDWSNKVEISEDQLVPHSEMQLGVLSYMINKAEIATKKLLLKIKATKKVQAVA